MAIAGDASPDATLPDASWLSALPSHPIFVAPKTSASKDDEPSPTCMTVRHADVIVSFGSELRMTSLLKVKHSASHGGAHRSTTSSSTASTLHYKRLTASALNFAIHKLSVNPTGNLIACVGSHKVAVVVLPRPGALASTKTERGLDASGQAQAVEEIPVKAAIVGPYYHHERIGGNARLADVQWHPWGEFGSSLLVMSRDGTLREYNVAQDVEEPAQTVSALSARASGQVAEVGSQSLGRSADYRARSIRSRSRSQTPMKAGRASIAASRSRRSTSKIAFDDDSASDDESAYEDRDFDESFYTAAGSIRSSGAQGRTVVAFSVGIDIRATEDDDSKVPSVAADWTPLTVYTLCSNGDLYALCPFMPQSASLPFSYLHSLASYIGLSRSSSTGEVSKDDANEDLPIRFVSSLLKEAGAQRRDSVRASTPQKARRSTSAAPMSLDESLGGRSLSTEQTSEEAQDDLVNVHRPTQTIVPSQPQPQGPFLLSPAPHELSEEREARATDVLFSRCTRKGQELNMIAIASDDGRLDMCIALDPILPLWPEKRATKTQSDSRFAAKPKAGRYALSDSSDEEDEEFVIVAGEKKVESLPTLLVYESIDLGLLDSLAKVSDDIDATLRKNSVRLVRDPLYADVFYVCHSAGAHAIGYGTWAREILDAMTTSSPGDPNNFQALQRVLHRGTPSDVAYVVSTVTPSAQGSSDGNAKVNPICDVCIVSDIYLCYSFLALSQSETLIAIELHLRVDEGSEAIEASLADAAQALPVEEGQRPAAYASLLGDGPPFTPPEPFRSFRGFPAQPRTPIGAGAQGELRVTPETLRALATTVERMRGQMRDVTQGGNAVQARLELQMEELKRQLSKLDTANRRIDAGQKKHDNDIQARLTRIMERQETIARRSDRLLQRLIESHSPELSVYEQKWLLELERLQEQLGTSEQKSDKTKLEESSSMTTLSTRVDAIRYRLDMLKPELEQAHRQRTDLGGKDTRSNTPLTLLGTKQLREIESSLAKEGQLLSTDRAKVLHLNSVLRRQLRLGGPSLLA